MSSLVPHVEQGPHCDSEAHLHQMQPIDLAQRNTQINTTAVQFRRSVGGGHQTIITQNSSQDTEDECPPHINTKQVPLLSMSGSVPLSVMQPLSLSRQPTVSNTLTSSVSTQRSSQFPPNAHSTVPPHPPGGCHMPRGAAAIANLVNPRSSMATPILRSNSMSQPSTGVSVTSLTAANYPGALGGVNPNPPHPRAGASAISTTSASSGLVTSSWTVAPTSSLIPTVTNSTTSPSISISMHKVVGPPPQSGPGLTSHQRQMASSAATYQISNRASTITANSRIPSISSRVESTWPSSTVGNAVINKSIQITPSMPTHLSQIHVTEKNFAKAPANLQSIPNQVALSRLHPSLTVGASNVSNALPLTNQTRFSIATVTTLAPSGLSGGTNPNFLPVPSTMTVQSTPVTLKATTTARLTGPKVISQSVATPIQITPLQTGGKPVLQSVQTMQPLHSVVAGLQQHGAPPLLSSSIRAVTYPANTTLVSCPRSSSIPANVSTTPPCSTSNIPVAKVHPQPPHRGISAVTVVGGAVQPVEVVLPPNASTDVTSHMQTTLTSQAPTNVYLHSSQRVTSPTLSSHEPLSSTSIENRIGGSSDTSTYTLPTTAYYYNTSQGYQVAPLVTHYTSSSAPYSIQATNTTIKPNVSQEVHGSFSSHDNMLRHNVHYQSHQSQQQSLPTKPTSSPRPSILRKRDCDGTPTKAQRNLSSLLSCVPSSSPPSSPKRPNSTGNGNSSNGSTTISATSSPGMHMEGNDDSLPPSIKPEFLDSGIDLLASVRAELIPGVSPRKKPRKQLLTINELQETRSSEEDMEFFNDRQRRRVSKDVDAEDSESSFYAQKPRMSLIQSYRHTWKSRHNHFIRHNDVRAKDDKRPTVTELANQNRIIPRVEGWKVFYLSTQMEELVETESDVYSRLSSVLSALETMCSKDWEKDLNGIYELIKGNMQRSKVISDQISEAKTQVIKVTDHKSRILDIVNKYVSKRIIKKRDKT